MDQMVIGYLVEDIQTDTYTVEKITCMYPNLWVWTNLSARILHSCQRGRTRVNPSHTFFRGGGIDKIEQQHEKCLCSYHNNTV